MKNMFLQARTIRVTILLYPPLPTLPRMTETVERSLAVHLGTNNRANPLIMDGDPPCVSFFSTNRDPRFPPNSRWELICALDFIPLTKANCYVYFSFLYVYGQLEKEKEREKFSSMEEINFKR